MMRYATLIWLIVIPDSNNRHQSFSGSNGIPVQSRQLCCALYELMAAILVPMPDDNETFASLRMPPPLMVAGCNDSATTPTLLSTKTLSSSWSRKASSSAEEQSKYVVDRNEGYFTKKVIISSKKNKDK